jgi:hypothetical protein
LSLRHLPLRGRDPNTTPRAVSNAGAHGGFAGTGPQLAGRL